VKGALKVFLKIALITILLPFVIIIPLVILGVWAAILLAFAQKTGMIP
jgi:hypothetical protein